VRGRPGDAAVSRLPDGVRLSVGTLTVLPTTPPRTVDREVAGWAMVLAPLVGLLLAVPTVALVLVLRGDDVGRGVPGGPSERPSALLVAALVIGLLALLTRGMHLDGLADTADGLGSGRAAEEALTVMRKSDIGPFGVLTLVLVVLVQVAALAQLLSRGLGAPALVVALTVSRLVLPLACSRGIPAARPGGLGHVVAGTVRRSQLLLSGLLALGGVLLAVAVAAASTSVATMSVAPPAALLAGHGGLGWFVAGLVACVVVPLGVAGLFLWRCVRRFGGVTGDVLGACVEVTFTAVLLVGALL
jgi:adenosylcobinamide-GDP ribazoletransferase